MCKTFPQALESTTQKIQMSAQDPNDIKLMDVAAEQRLHKRRQRNRNQERKRIALKDLLARVTELDKTVLGTTGMSMETLQDIYHPISMEDMQFFWQHVPNICNPIKAELNTVSDAHRLERDRKKGDQFKKKLKRKLENGTISLEERNNLLQWHTRSNTTTDDSNNNDKGDKNAFSLLTMDRGRRKAWQIENFCHLLDQKLKKRSSCQQMTVVDFGCGSGNLCLALAAYFKTVHFVLVDKREYPLKLVERRAKEAGLTNIQVLQYTFSPQNLNHFEVKDQYGQYTTHFDVGIGLHCCGSFTDMVMTICLARGADW